MRGSALLPAMSDEADDGDPAGKRSHHRQHGLDRQTQGGENGDGKSVRMRYGLAQQTIRLIVFRRQTRIVPGLDDGGCRIGRDQSVDRDRTVNMGLRDIGLDRERDQKKQGNKSPAPGGWRAAGRRSRKDRSDCRKSQLPISPNSAVTLNWLCRERQIGNRRLGFIVWPRRSRCRTGRTSRSPR